MLLPHPATKRLAELLLGRLDPPIGKAGQFGRIGLAGNQRFDNRPAALAHHVRKHRVELDIGVFEGLLHA
jgi:hypothetical protein